MGRKWSDFVELHKRIRLELPGKVLPPLPRRNKKNSYLSAGADDDEDADSLSSVSTQDATHVSYAGDNTSDNGSGGGGLRSYLPIPGSHRRNASKSSLSSSPSRRPSGENFTFQQRHVLYREEQRVSLRAFLRTFLKNEQIAQSKAMAEFLTRDPVSLNEEEMEDIERRKEMDERRVEDQRRFYEIARQRAAELDVHMEKFRREIVEASEYLKCHSFVCSVLILGRRRTVAPVPGDTRQKQNLGVKARISEIRRVVQDRVCSLLFDFY